MHLRRRSENANIPRETKRNYRFLCADNIVDLDISVVRTRFVSQMRGHGRASRRFWKGYGKQPAGDNNSIVNRLAGCGDQSRKWNFHTSSISSRSRDNNIDPELEVCLARRQHKARSPSNQYMSIDILGPHRLNWSSHLKRLACPDLEVPQ